MRSADSRATGVLWLAAGCALAACDGGKLVGTVPDPCLAPDACVVRGADLAVLAPVVVAPSEAALIPGASVRVAVEVWNRGSEHSQATTLSLALHASPAVTAREVDVAPMAAGERLRDTLEFVVPDPGTLASTDTARLTAALDVQTLRDDPLHGNDEVTVSLPIRVPVLSATLNTAPDTIVLGHAAPMSVTFHNRSATETAPAGVLAFCLLHFDTGCFGRYPPFGLAERPALAPGQSWTTTLQPVVTPAASFLDESWTWTLAVCAAEAGTTIEQMGDPARFFERRCWRGPPVVAVPDYEGMCDVRPLPPGATVDGTTAVPCDHHDRAWHVWRLVGAQGDVLIQTTRTALVRDARGGKLAEFWGTVAGPNVHEMRATVPDTAYVLVLGTVPYRLTVTPGG